MPIPTVNAVAWKQRKATTDHTAISIRITLNRIHRFVKTSHQVPLQYWQDGQVKKPYPYADIINADLMEKVAKIRKDLLLLNEESPLTIRAIEGYLEGKKDTAGTQSFTNFVMENIDKAYNGERLAPESVRLYTIHLNKIHTFAGRNNLLFSDIDSDFLKAYAKWCKESEGNEDATIWNSLTKFVRRFHRMAKKEIKGYKHDPFANFIPPAPPKSSGRSFLVMEELDRIEAVLPRLTEAETSVANYFLLECYCGIRQSDWNSAQVKNMVKGESLMLFAKKNNSPIFLNLNNSPRLKAVLDRIDGQPFPHTQEYANRALKIIAAKAGINKQVSTHTGRHTCAVLFAELGYSKEYVAELLGVSMKTVEWYYKVTRRKLALENERLGGI